MVVEFFSLVLKETTTRICFSYTWKIFLERWSWRVLNAHGEQLSEEKKYEKICDFFGLIAKCVFSNIALKNTKDINLPNLGQKYNY